MDDCYTIREGHDVTTYVDEETNHSQNDTHTTPTPHTDVEGLGKDLTCNEADVDDLLSSGESTV